MYTAMTTQTTGNLISATQWNYIVDNWTWAGSLKRNGSVWSGLANSTEMLGNWGAKAHNSTTISIANITWTDVTFDTEGANGWDSGTIHSVSTNTQNFTCPVAGKYLCFCEVYWASNATGFRAIRVNHAGAQISEQYAINLVATAFTMQHVWVANAAASDVIKFQVYQNSGGSLNITNSGSYGISGGIQWIGV